MARQENGYLGGFSGKLGPAVGYQRYGVWYLRAKPRMVNNPRTEAQQEHRAMFKEEVQLAARMRWAVNTGMTAVARQMRLTAQNLFVKANQHCFSVVDGAFTVDYSGLSVSAGPVAPVALGEATVDDAGVLTVPFEKNPCGMPARAYDSVFLWVYCAELGEGYLASPVYRRTQSVSLLLPDGFAGRALHLYAFVQDDQGRCSATAYGCFDNGDDSSLNGELDELDEAGAERFEANYSKAGAFQTKADYEKGEVRRKKGKERSENGEMRRGMT